ncbi:MAG: ribonuclease H-like domain-containing protein [Thermoplasmata archaeon]
MLRSTFHHLEGISLATEASLWRSGIRDWSELADGLDRIGAPGSPRRERIARGLSESEAALAERRGEFFARRLSYAEHWRIYPAFRPATAFLDIETTSLSPFEGMVTVVTVHGGGATRSFVADDNLEELPAYLRRFHLMVTFNGRLFDLPFLQFRFPQWSPPAGHFDLRFALYRVGQAGGLKRIEERLRLGSRAGVEGIQGLDAVRLWEQHRRGSASALDRLIQYNRADAVNLEPLAEWTVRELTRRSVGSAVAPPGPVRPAPSEGSAAVGAPSAGRASDR